MSETFRRQFIKHHETYGGKPDLDAYRCESGFPTIGFGNRFLLNGDEVQMGMTITAEEADSLFEKAYAEAVAIVHDLIGTDLPEVVETAMISVAYNTGRRTLSTFKKTIAYLQAGQWIEAAQELLDSRRAGQFYPNNPRVIEEANMIASVSNRDPLKTFTQDDVPAKWRGERFGG